ncbi:hypothetical protein B566_EDAN003110 [Ephemera danica]|nr:hypothetical protein B566_EDAN003110 [Ephemera danica]
MIVTMETCVVCGDKSAKYKCPTCRSPYCSVKCCKQHKENPCKAAPSKTTVSQTAHQRREPPMLNFETDDTVPREKLTLLEQNEKLRNLLSNRHLQTLLSTVDNAPNAANVMEAAMQEPIFVEFADLCLNTSVFSMRASTFFFALSMRRTARFFLRALASITFLMGRAFSSCVRCFSSSTISCFNEKL